MTPPLAAPSAAVDVREILAAGDKLAAVATHLLQSGRQSSKSERQLWSAIAKWDAAVERNGGPVAP